MIKWLLLSVFGFLAIDALPLSIGLNAEHAACGYTNGTVYANVWGGTAPYAFSWNSGVSGVMIDTTSTILFNLAPGYYELTVTDGSGATAVEGIDVLDLTGLRADWIATTLHTCDGACTNMSFVTTDGTLGGVSPYTVTVDLPATGSVNETSYQDMVWLQMLCPGATYQVSVADVNGCSYSWPITVVGHSTPSPPSQTVLGTCDNSYTGSVVYQFDQPVEILYAGPYIGTGPDPIITYGAPGEVTLSNLTVGGYILYAAPVGGDMCYDSLFVNVPSLGAGCGTVAGTVFADLQNDCLLNAGDVGIPYRMVTIEPGEILRLCDQQGAYSADLPLGNYTASAVIPAFTNNCTIDPTPFALTAIDPLIELDLAMESIGPDAAVHLEKCCHALGDTARYWITVTNAGPYSLSNLSVTLEHSTLLTLQSTQPVNASSIPGEVGWTLPTLAPFGSATFFATLLVPTDPLLLGTIIEATATISSTPADAEPTNDSYTIPDIVIGPYDPNDKQARTSSGNSTDMYFVDVDTHVDYTIRFQNTGSAPANHVRLIDTISSALDLASFELLGASHAYEVQLLPERILRFDFPNIMLPDSAADPSGSNGYISFRLKPAAPSLGSSINNTADIYFDFNPPIRTNTAALEVDVWASVAQYAPRRLQLLPNPVRDVLFLVDLEPGAWNIEVWGADGRRVMNHLMTGDRLQIPVHDLAAGAYMLRATNRNGVAHMGRFIRE